MEQKGPYLMPKSMESIISDAMISTEKEIAGDAWGDEEIAQDETGDRTLEAMGDGLEGQHEPDDDEEETEGEESEGESEEESDEEEGEKAEGEAKPAAKANGEAKPAAKAEPEPQGRVPSSRLREANDRTRAVEAERDAVKSQLEARETEFKKQIDAVNSRFDQLMASLAKPGQQQAQPTAETKPAAPPDLWENPDGFFAHQTKPIVDQVTQLRNDLAAQRFETSMAIAHGRHGEAFTKAFDAINKLNPNNPDERAVVKRIYDSPNPGESLVEWHKRTEVLREVGTDPAKYRERVQAETREALMKDPDFRKQLIESLRAEANTGDEGGPRTQVRLPKSLNGAVGGNRRMADPGEFDDSDQAVADSAWR